MDFIKKIRGIKKMTLKARKENRYGNEIIKPISPELVEFLRALGKKELTRNIIQALTALNIDLEII